MQDLTSRKLTFKNYLVVASLLFGLFFGAGNLIFPFPIIEGRFRIMGAG